MKQFLRYTCFLYVLLCLISCKQKHELIASDLEMDSSFETNHYSVSNELLARELYKIKVDSSLINLKNKDSVLAFYQLRNGTAAWTSSNNRTALYNSIKNADKEGLIPEEYHINTLQKAITNTSSELRNNVFTDLFLTDVYLTYAYHLANGKLDPNSLYDDWQLKPNQFQFNTSLNLALEKEKLIQSLDKYKPQHKIYNQLVTELQKAKKLLHQDSLRTKVKQGHKIRPNRADDRIISIRKRLNEIGLLEDSLVNNSKKLDTLLQKRIKTFQLENNLQVDAVIGERTVSVLNRSNKDNYLSVLANLERWRWFPRKFETPSIVVNIPQYQLIYTSSNKQYVHNIVVGKTERKTPVFSSVVKHIDINPLWYIPPTIKKEDIIPSATKDVDYLRKKNISVYNREGKEMILDSINWNSNTPQSYSYVQAPGNSNALGQLKIIFPNDFSVYLHDTPSKSLFNKNFRAKSSGCVRVENVFKLASKLLDWSEEEVTKAVDHKTTRRVIPQHKTQVHILYWSITFNEKSEPIFLNDVYQLDNTLGKLLTY